MHRLGEHKDAIPSPAKPKESTSFDSYVIFAAGFFVLLMVFGAQSSFGVFFKPLLEEFGWTRATTSGAYSLNMVLSGFLGIIAGRLTDRFGSRQVVTVGGLCFGLGLLLMSRTNTVWQIYLSYGVLAAIGLACIWVPVMSTVARWFVKRRGLISGIITSGVSVGMVVMPLLANHLISTYGWRTSYAILGLAVLVGCTTAAQFLKRGPGHTKDPVYNSNNAAKRTGQMEVGLSAAQAVHTRQFWMLSALYCLFGFCMQTVFVHLVPHAIDVGISATGATALLSIVGGVSVIGRIGLGSLEDRLGGRRTLVLLTALQSIAFFWLPFAAKLLGLDIFAVVYAVGYGAMLTVQAPIVYEFFGLTAHGAVLGLATVGMTIGGAIGPLVAGRLFDTNGSYYWAFAICAAFSVASLVIASLLKPTSVQRFR